MTLILKLDVTGRAIGWLTADDGAAPVDARGSSWHARAHATPSCVDPRRCLRPRGGAIAGKGRG